MYVHAKFKKEKSKQVKKKSENCYINWSKLGTCIVNHYFSII